MACGPLFGCTVGQRCSTTGFCESSPCGTDAECPGITLCINSRCQPKKNSGESCNRTVECVSQICDNGSCTAINRKSEPLTSNRSADIALAVLITLCIAAFLVCCIVCFRANVCGRTRNSRAVVEEKNYLPENSENEVGVNKSLAVSVGHIENGSKHNAAKEFEAAVDNASKTESNTHAKSIEALSNRESMFQSSTESGNSNTSEKKELPANSTSSDANVVGSEKQNSMTTVKEI